MTDIYKNRQQMPVAKNKPKRRRRRSSSSAAFDANGERRRRSRNSGFRRMVHLFRKPANEMKIWWGVLITAMVLLTIVGIWQFWYREHVARERSKQSEMVIPIQSPSQTDSASE